MTRPKANPRWRTRRPDVSADEVALRYREGQSTKEIATALGCSSRTVAVRLVASGVTLRAQGKFKRYASGHGTNWRGDEASYSVKHRRVYYHRGQPQHCEECGRTDDGVAYDWANLTGNYGDITDYRRMCRPCHRRFDYARARA